MLTFFYYAASVITLFFLFCFLVLFICGTIILFRNEKAFITRRNDKNAD